jgi:hydroxymethylbilane synthase
VPTGMRPQRIATRGSTLALKQAHTVANMLRPLLGGEEISINIVSTRGDVRQDISLAQLGEGVFVKALEEELLSGRADIAVHSLKDLPSVEVPGLMIGAVPVREDPRDALVTRDGRDFSDVPTGAILATGSPRRIAQLRALRPDLQFTGVRGNVDTRLRKLDEGQFDGLVVAVAGLSRLGLHKRISTVFSPEHCVPAVGQGALAIQCRSDDAETLALVARVNDEITDTEIRAERSFLAAIGGGCRVPVGAIARRNGDKLQLLAVVADESGQDVARSEMNGPASDANRVGRLVADDLSAMMARLANPGLGGS